MSLRRLPVFLLLLALGASPGFARQQGPQQRGRHSVFSIGGNLRDSIDHRALENFLVTLKLLTGPIVNSAYTRSNGEFQFDGLGDGDYILEVVARDFDAFHETISINEASHLGLTIFLNKSGKAPIPPEQLTISAHQLSVPHKAHDEFEKGMALIYLKSDYRAAIAQFQLAIKDFPTYYEAYAEEGGAYYQLKEFGPAEEALRKSIDLSSGQYADALFSLAALLNDLKRFPEAETISRKGISVDKSSWRGPFELARALTALKQPEEAKKSAEQSRDLMPDNPPVYLLLANTHIQLKDYPALLRDLDEYLRLAPSAPEAEQARKTRERVQAMLNAPKADAADGGQDKSQEDDEDDDDATPDKASPSSAQPRPAALPSLPPPTAGNP